MRRAADSGGRRWRRCGRSRRPASSPLHRCSGCRRAVTVIRFSCFPASRADDASTVALRWSIRGQGYSTARRGGSAATSVPPTAIVTGIRSRPRRAGRTPRAHRQHRRLEPRWHLRAAARTRATRPRASGHLAGQPVSDGRGRQELGDGAVASGSSTSTMPTSTSTGSPSRTDRSSRCRRRRSTRDDDGVAPWQTCIDEIGPLAENIEVYGSHAALGAHPAVTFAVLDRLRLSRGTVAPVPAAVRAAAVVPTSGLVAVPSADDERDSSRSDTARWRPRWWQSADPTVVALPVGLAQLPLEDLAGGVARQLVDEVDRRRALVVRQAGAGVGDDLGLADIGARRRGRRSPSPSRPSARGARRSRPPRRRRDGSSATFSTSAG